MYRQAVNGIVPYTTTGTQHYSCCLCVGIPPVETFAFVFNTLLNDIATHNMAWADRIIDAQVGKELLRRLSP